MDRKLDFELFILVLIAYFLFIALVIILSVNLSPVLVIKPKYPHSLYMVVAMPLCRYLICASVH